MPTGVVPGRRTAVMQVSRARLPRPQTKRGPCAGPLGRYLAAWETMVQVDLRRRRSSPRPASPAPNRVIEAGSGTPGGDGVFGVKLYSATTFTEPTSV